MLETMMVSSGSVMYVMAAVGILGVLAKIVNRMTLYRLIKAAGNMPKSTHKLMKLVKAKYEHACMAHESVENVGVFVEKYIYEYRGFLFRIHTWRQIELLSVWFVGILAVIGAALSYMEGGLTETVYQYIAGGAAEAVLLMVIIRMSDEPYKIKAIKMYMVDYLENVCAVRVRRQNRKEKEFIDVIPSENVNGDDLLSSYGLLPAIVAGCILAGILAATMSTADSQLLAAASAFSENVLQDVFGVKLTSKQNMLAARLTVVVIAFIAIFLAADPNSNVFKIVSFAWAGFGATFGPAVLFALFWRRSNRQGVLAGLVAGGLMIFAWKFCVRPLGGIWDIYELMPAFVVNCIVLVVVSLATPAPEKSITDVFDKVRD